ncbi:MAG: iron chelate uptake ABC transporter family permease subunit, partial [Kordiimonadaceae bacterium]|nr:iron chelate uptake ABC transporter family permease subunit [Kordiimonadaceae bacterium]
MIAYLTRKPWALNVALTVALAVAALLSGLFGQVTLSIGQFTEALFASGNDGMSIIVRELRLPRIILGMMAGATLSYTGAALQGLLRNPLADPG